MIDINKYISENRTYRHYWMTEIVCCKDGFTMSIQASQYHYSTPKNDKGPYTAVEVGYPSKEEPLLMDYVDNPLKPTDTVYAYVPVEVIEKVIEKHGGLNE